MKIVLIGMAGVGKSHIGKKLSQKLNFDFIDLDLEMEKETGLHTTPLLEKVGDEEFIRIEDEIFSRIIEKSNTVFSPGGSIIYCESFQKNFDKFTVFYLKGNKEIILQRIQKEPRGIVYLKGKTFDELFEEREKLYEKFSHHTIDAIQNEEQILENIHDIII